MRIRDAKPEELTRPAQAKELTPRQKAILERESKFRKLIDGLNGTQIKAIEPESTEKLGTLQAALVKVLEGDARGVHVAVKHGTIYVSLSPIPGARKAAAPKA
jgi:hypothetical protein